MENLSRFKELFKKGWIQKLCKHQPEKDYIDFKSELQEGPIESQDSYRLFNAIIPEIKKRTKFTTLQTNRAGIYRYDIAISNVFVFSQDEIWELFHRFKEMSDKDKMKFMKEWGIKVYKSGTDIKNDLIN